MPPRLLTLLRLTRFPAVFTALADIAAGFLLTHPSWQPAEDFAFLLLASAGLYLSGMVLNDVCDVEQDTRERPRRPIPSGAISRSAATAIGTVLMLTGIAAAFAVGTASATIALLLAGCIAAYDRFLKRTPAGPLAMGSCRLLNLLLGASSTATALPEVWNWPQLWVAAAMGIYITGVTWFARTEARISSRSSLLGATLVINLGLTLLGAWVGGITSRLSGWEPAPLAEPSRALAVWGVILAVINARTLRAIKTPQPGTVQAAVGTMLMSVITLNALTIYGALGANGLPYVAATLFLLVPSVLIKRWIAVT